MVEDGLHALCLKVLPELNFTVRMCGFITWYFMYSKLVELLMYRIYRKSLLIAPLEGCAQEGCAKHVSLLISVV